MKELDMDSLKEEMQKGKLVVDFWAPWCGPCRMFAPTFEKVADENKDVGFAKLDVEANPEAGNELGITSIPCVIFFKDGQEVARLMGMQDEDGFKQKIGEVF